MADTRVVKIKIWSDGWFLKLKPEAKLIFMFLLTNKAAQICGYYEMSLEEMAMYLNTPIEKIKKTLPALEPKVMYRDGWVIIKNYAKHQNYANNAKVQLGIERQLKEVPPHLLNINDNDNYNKEPIDRLSIGYQATAQNIEGEDKGVDNNEDKVKKKYGEFKNVLLTDTEKEKLKQKYGVNEVKKLVEELSRYMESKPTKYKSHYAVILQWASRKGLTVITSTSVPKMIPETVNGTVRFIPNPDYHD